MRNFLMVVQAFALGTLSLMGFFQWLDGVGYFTFVNSLPGPLALVGGLATGVGMMWSCLAPLWLTELVGPPRLNARASRSSPRYRSAGCHTWRSGTSDP